jgi:hypothetical protein
MGVDTTLRINSKWGMSEIANALRVSTGREVQIKVIDSEGLEDCAYIMVGERQIFVSRNSKTPLGTCTYLSLSSNPEGHSIFKGLAEIIGGFYQENDFEDKYEFISGEISDDNGLPYFIRYAITHDGVEHDDIEGLLESMNNWYDKCDIGNKPNFLRERFAKEG